VRLTPREVERLLLFQAAELARRRQARGLRLNQAEATAVIADEVCEAARDGLGYGDVVARGYAVVGPEDVLEGVGALVPRIEVEALFEDGMRLIVLHDPIGQAGPPPPLPEEPPLVWSEQALGPFVALNTGETPIAGLRVVRGHGGLVDGELDAPGARERALQLARERGYLGA
jgi:urease subunit gamma/beta